MLRQFETGFSIAAAVIVALLIIELVFASITEESATPSERACEFQDVWREQCEEEAAAHKLSGQKIRVFLMPCRGRDAEAIAEKLVMTALIGAGFTNQRCSNTARDGGLFSSPSLAAIPC